MATDKKLAPNIDASDLVNFPNGRIKDNSGIGDGTPVNRLLYSDLHEVWAKLMRNAKILYNGLPDNEANGYQLLDALKALAGKNVMITDLNTSAGFVTIGLKLSTLVLGEAIVCQAKFDFTSETQIKGTEASPVINLTIGGNFKNGDYIRLIKTSAGITLVRLADALNIDTLVGEKNYLKAANNSQEFTGTAIDKATTPASNKAAFARRVNGADSGTYLASGSQNGLLSIADKGVIDSIASSPIKNTGWVSGIEVAGNTVGAPLAVSGDISSATCTARDLATPQAAEYEINLVNAMADVNYFVMISAESQTPTANTDASVYMPVFRNKATGSFTIILREGMPGVQSIKLHLQVVQLT